MFVNFVRCHRIIWPDQKWLIIILLSFSILSSLLPFLQSGANALLIDQLISASTQNIPINQIYVVLSLLIAAYTISPIILSLNLHFVRLFWFYGEKKFQMIVLEKLASLDIAIHENPKYQDLISKVNEGGIYRLQNFLDRQFFIVQNILELFIASSILFYAEWWILIIILLGTIPGMFNELKYGRQAWSIWDTTMEIRRRYGDLKWRFHKINSITEMKLYQNTRHFLRMITGLFTNFQNQEIANQKVKVRLELLAIFLSQITLAVAIVYFVQQVIDGLMQIGTLTFMIAAINTFRSSISSLFMNIARQYQENLFVNDTFKLLDIKPAIPQVSDAHIVNSKHVPLIEFQNVDFKYPGTTKYVLKNFSLTIRPGEKIAIIGINGAGKTTLIKLLCRFYDVNHGQIMINGINIKKINLDSWYKIIGALFQDYERYHFMVKDVISLGRSQQSPSMHKIKSAAKNSEASIFIEEWGKKYQQMLGKAFTEGVEPSVGQWQKLSLAKTFYRDPKVLILDEPTASIDAEAEAKIFAKLNQISRNRTVILISHRFSTVRHADKICVIEKGKLSEYGSHKKLLKNNQTYARLFKLQAKGYK